MLKNPRIQRLFIKLAKYVYLGVRGKMQKVRKITLSQLLELV